MQELNLKLEDDAVIIAQLEQTNDELQQTAQDLAGSNEELKQIIQIVENEKAKIQTTQAFLIITVVVLVLLLITTLFFIFKRKRK